MQAQPAWLKAEGVRLKVQEGLGLFRRGDSRIARQNPHASALPLCERGRKALKAEGGRLKLIKEMDSTILKFEIYSLKFKMQAQPAERGYLRHRDLRAVAWQPSGFQEQDFSDIFVQLAVLGRAERGHYFFSLFQSLHLLC